MTEHSTRIYLWPSSVLNTVKHTPGKQILYIIHVPVWKLLINEVNTVWVGKFSQLYDLFSFRRCSSICWMCDTSCSRVIWKKTIPCYSNVVKPLGSKGGKLKWRRYFYFIFMKFNKITLTSLLENKCLRYFRTLSKLLYSRVSEHAHGRWQSTCWKRETLTYAMTNLKLKTKLKQLTFNCNKNMSDNIFSRRIF